MRLIDADAVLDILRNFDHQHADLDNGSEDFVYGVETAIEVIENAPTADVVKGVRCLLCEHLDPTSPSGTVEPVFYKCKRRKIYVDPYDCCAFGERRKTNED